MPRCARPSTGNASKPASAQKNEAEEKKRLTRERGNGRKPKTKTESREPGDDAAARPVGLHVPFQGRFPCISIDRSRSQTREEDREKERFETEEDPEGPAALRRR